jgi:tetratricopeptide (TPR) repeat protein
MRARQHHKDGHFGLAVNQYKKAYSHQPNNASIYKKLADVRYSMAAKKKSAKEAFLHTLKAKDAYLKAAKYNPVDAEIAYGLAKAESRLAVFYQFLYPKEKENPYNPIPYLEKAIQLRPNGITYHYAMARYLYFLDQEKELLRIVRSLARMYPPAYDYLKKEALWSPSVKEAVKMGILDAISQGISAGKAHKALSSILEEDKEWADAITHYRMALESYGDKVSGNDFINLGRLYLQDRQIDKAEIHFIKGLYMTKPMETALGKICNTYKGSGHLDDFHSFYQEVNQRFILSPQMHILAARYLIDIKQYNKAQRILQGLNDKNPTAEAYYWLARMAEMEKDWDSMELNIQKATVLDPYNTNYRRKFFGLLKKLGKLETAERQLDLVIQNSEKPSARLFDERARFKWNSKDFSGAVKDWQEAIRLEPKQASFYAQVAESYIKLGNFNLAIEYYQKAMMLSPGNHGYVEKYNLLKGKSS